MSSKVALLLDSKGIKYKDTGGDLITACLNPEHKDNNPSLRIDPHTGAMHCLSCGFGKGIPSIFHYFNEESLKDSSLLYSVRGKIKELLGNTVSLSIPEDAQLYQNSFRDIKVETISKYFAFQHSDWVDRIVFPITDSVGKILFFLGRRINGGNSLKYMVKPKGIPPPVFPMRYNKPTLILVEGIFDMLNLEDKGVDNVVCCFGTHQFTGYNILEKLTPYIIAGTKQIVILLDNDSSGIKASETLAQLIRDKTRLRPIIATELLPKKKDPGELTQEDVDTLVNNIGILLANQS